ncbi:MAG: TRAP transporter large permease subunit [Deltaproteobacteria bacterium]|nr:TRAP transporter large permease subunit [Deltaproteobacteria bacterium]
MANDHSPARMDANSVFPRLSSFTRRLNGLAMACMFGLVFFSVVAVVARYFFNAPIPGDNEIVELIMVGAVFIGAVAVAQLDKNHVNIDMVLLKLSPRARILTEALTLIFGILLMGLLVWSSWETASLFAENGNTTLMMTIPLYPFAFLIPLGVFLLLLVMTGDLIGCFRQAAELGFQKTLGGLVFALTTLLLLLAVLWLRHTWEVDPLVLGVVGLLFCVLLFVTGMPVSFSMFVAGFLGMAYLRGVTPALGFLGDSLWRTTANYSYAVAPLFITMGYFILHADISRELFEAAYKWVGKMHGGLAAATIAACAAYGAVVGVPFMGPVSMGTIAMPEMKRYGYDDALSSGSICAGGTLGTLIPPSVPLIFYGILTQQSIGVLFVAGIVPGLITMAVWMIQVYLMCRKNPQFGPPGPLFSIKEKTLSLGRIWPVLALFVIVVGGMYYGIMTPVEAGAFGAFGALLIGICQRRYTGKKFLQSLAGSCVMVAMMFMMLAGAKVLGSFFVLSRFPYALSEALTAMALPPTLIILLVCAVIVILSCFIDGLVLLFICVPIFFPIITNFGFDPIWFGVVICILTNIGALTPPFALNVFALKGVCPELPIGTIYRGVLPFMCSNIAVLVVFILFPEIITWLPNLISR